ncbi:MAG: hypothetical protein LUH48_02340 [Clostridiales bacterium]|nr:hypothetical protein [Clostridiales bacterium]
MTSTAAQALKNAAASSAVEGLPLSQSQLDTVAAILEGKLSLSEYLQSLKDRQEA